MSDSSQPTTTSKVLTANGLTMPVEFPAAAYEAVHQKMAPFSTANNDVYAQFAGAWNAVSYRYRALVEYDESFGASISKYGAAPNALERYRQERDLFGFFSNGFSTFEAFFYATSAAGALLQPNSFPIVTAAEQQRITPNSTIAAFLRAFPNDGIISSLNALTEDGAYMEWREIRNILTHRSAPGRTLHVTFGGGETPPDQWKLSNIALNQDTTASRRAHVARLLAVAFGALDRFAEAHFSNSTS